MEGKTLWTSPLSDRKVPSVFLRNFVSRVFRFLFVYLFYIFFGDYNGIFRLSQTSFSQICSTIASYEERNVEFELMRNGKNNLSVKFDRLHNDIYMDEGMQFSISGHSPLGLFPAETLKDTDVIKVATTPMPVLFYLSFWLCFCLYFGFVCLFACCCCCCCFSFFSGLG